MPRSIISSTAGSSPRMRGTQTTADQSYEFSGIIPAYAGNTNCGARVHLVHGDHPRVCGEHPRAPITKFHGAGSSPRMRGTPIACRIRSVRVGIIPAYAGNTFSSPRTCLWSGDHPRVCGEHVSSNSQALSNTGSSPRMRGTPWYCASRAKAGRIIPAYAGNTRRIPRKRTRREDHPRVCGEHFCKIRTGV